MVAERKTPGVYIVEQNAFPNSVVEVATAIPAFIGCTQKAARGSKSLIGVPTKITSMDDYAALFGIAPVSANTVTYAKAAAPGGEPTVSMIEASQFYFYSSMRLFFDNGGGPCYVVSVALFDDVVTNGGMANINFDDKCTAPLLELQKELDVTMVIVPDAVRAGLDSWQKICQQVLDHCVKMQSRIGIFDVVKGNLKRTLDDTDVISGTNGFRAKISGDGDNLNYATAYYPWLNTSINEASDVTFAWVSDDTRTLLVADLIADAQIHVLDPGKLAKLTDVINSISSPMTAPLAKQAHLILNMQSPLYQQVMGEILELSNVVPPSGAMAGVYARVDHESGVFWAPANVTINSVVSPTISVSDDQQEDLNVPLDGKAINAIRVIPNRDLVVWGARTLDGNSEDWRYINVRRTLIMLEQSIKNAAMAFVFHPNVSVTWVSIKSMIVNFLTDRWKEGALAGTKAEEAFSVDVGLGTTMTATDILDGYLNISVNVALSHPAEFIVLTFKQQLQKS